jgi:hypothetical protein
MSFFAKAVANVGQGVGSVVNKYLDEQIAKDRAEFMAQLQRRTAGEIRTDDFAFKTDPGRIQTTRDIAAGDVAAKATATRDAEKAGWSDTEYQQGKDAQTKKETDEEVRKKTLFAQAEAKYRARTPGSDDPFAKLPPAVRASYQGLAKQAEQINAAITKAQADGMWEPDKNKSQSDLLIRQRVLEDKAQELLQPYLPKQGKGGASPDDNIRALLTGGAAGPAAAAPGAATPAPANKPAAAADPQREAMSLRQRGQADTRAAAQGINSAAQAALRGKDPAQAQQVMDSPSFNLLDQATKTAVRNLVYGR